MFLDLSATQQGLRGIVSRSQWSHLDHIWAQPSVPGSSSSGTASSQGPEAVLEGWGERAAWRPVWPQDSGTCNLAKAAQHLQCERLEGLPSSSFQIKVKNQQMSLSKISLGLVTLGYKFLMLWHDPALPDSPSSASGPFACVSRSLWGHNNDKSLSVLFTFLWVSFLKWKK